MGCEGEGYTPANPLTWLLDDFEMDEYSEENLEACSDDLSQSTSEELPFSEEENSQRLFQVLSGLLGRVKIFFAEETGFANGIQSG